MYTCPFKFYVDTILIHFRLSVQDGLAGRLLLYFDRTGLCVWSKRLEQGRLISNWANIATHEMDWIGLKLLLEGIEPKRVRLRYKKPHSHSGNATTHGLQTI